MPLIIQSYKILQNSSVLQSVIGSGRRGLTENWTVLKE